MSKLEELIKEFCPNGVEYKNFYSVCKYVRGITYSSVQELFNPIDGTPVLRANNIDLQTNTLILEDIKFVDESVKIKEEQWLKKDDILICAGSGSKEHIGKIAYIFKNVNMTFGGFMGVIRANRDLLLSRFLFHFLTSNMFKRHLSKVSASNSSTINNINNETWRNLQIPLPALPVQREIVRVLDSFTLYSAELTAELTARRKQYEFYRDKLLNFSEGSVLKYVIKTASLSDSEDIKFVSNINTHCDFLIYNKLNKEIEMVVEVDGSQHKEDVQAARDKRKDRLLTAAGIKILRLPTTTIECKEKIIAVLTGADIEVKIPQEKII